mmetsp:Transcript_19633/g.63788  ORF Transcript_19633/g.63788 Transcript_19633/m.63788 type:complete len:241 (+) Transcript_19633:960-1682(+)
MKSCIPKMPKIVNKKRLKIMTFPIIGMHCSMVSTSLRIPGMAERVRSGRRTRTILIAEMFPPSTGSKLIQLTTTTRKSKQFHESWRYEVSSRRKPIAQTLMNISHVKMAVKIGSDCLMIWLRSEDSSDVGSMKHNTMAFAAMVSNTMVSKIGISLIVMQALRTGWSRDINPRARSLYTCFCVILPLASARLPSSLRSSSPRSSPSKTGFERNPGPDTRPDSDKSTLLAKDAIASTALAVE